MRTGVSDLFSWTVGTWLEDRDSLDSEFRVLQDTEEVPVEELSPKE